MVGNADIQAEQGGERAQQALGLPPRPTKGQAQQVPGLDRYVRVIPRPTAPTRAGRAPGRDRLRRDPDRQVPPPLQRPVIFRPVLDPVARPWDLVAARLIEPVGHRASSRRGSGPISLRRRPAQTRERHFCTNARCTGFSMSPSEKMIAECAIAPPPATSPCSAKSLSTLLPPIAAVKPAFA